MACNIHHPWEGYVKPFKIFGNLYFVGTVPAIESFIDEKVDILLGNHVHNNDTVGKEALITEDFNPFIDDTAWKKFLTRVIKTYCDMESADE